MCVECLEIYKQCMICRCPVKVIVFQYDRILKLILKTEPIQFLILIGVEGRGFCEFVELSSSTLVKKIVEERIDKRNTNMNLVQVCFENKTYHYDHIAED